MISVYKYNYLCSVKTIINTILNMIFQFNVQLHFITNIFLNILFIFKIFIISKTLFSIGFAFTRISYHYTLISNSMYNKVKGISKKGRTTIYVFKNKILNWILFNIGLTLIFLFSKTIHSIFY